MSVFPLVSWILLELLITKELYALQCELGTYHRYRKDGRERCKKCTLCNAGEGWNTSVEIKVDAEHGYLECYRCSVCLDGYYRPTHSAFQTCYKCQLDCKRLNRYGSVSCGYDSSGHCGDCMSGYKAESREPNDICFETDVRKQTTEMKVPTPSRPQNSWTLDTSQIALLILGSATMVAVLITIFTMIICYWTKKHETGQAPSYVILMATAEFSNPHHVVDRAIDKDDETLSMIATTISGKNVPIFFDHLQIHRSKTDPEEELWERGKITYPNYILNVLVEWTKSAQPFPNLVWLCDALKKASFHKVVEQILTLEENQVVVND